MIEVNGKKVDSKIFIKCASAFYGVNYPITAIDSIKARVETSMEILQLYYGGDIPSFCELFQTNLTVAKELFELISDNQKPKTKLQI
jgi:hypothetical protein